MACQWDSDSATRKGRDSNSAQRGQVATRSARGAACQLARGQIATRIGHNLNRTLLEQGTTRQDVTRKGRDSDRVRHGQGAFRTGRDSDRTHPEQAATRRDATRTARLGQRDSGRARLGKGLTRTGRQADRRRLSRGAAPPRLGSETRSRGPARSIGPRPRPARQATAGSHAGAVRPATKCRRITGVRGGRRVPVDRGGVRRRRQSSRTPN